MEIVITVTTSDGTGHEQVVELTPEAAKVARLMAAYMATTESDPLCVASVSRLVMDQCLGLFGAVARLSKAVEEQHDGDLLALQQYLSDQYGEDHVTV